MRVIPKEKETEIKIKNGNNLLRNEFKIRHYKIGTVIHCELCKHKLSSTALINDINTNEIMS